jgi:DNA-binding NarL/FixJ family response regulator
MARRPPLQKDASNIMPPTPSLITVWLVEDNRPFRETLAGLLERTEGFSCPQAVGNAEKSLRLLATQPAPDIILLDINLPGLDGIEAVRRFKAAAPDLLVLMLTVFEDNERVFDAICAGANGYLLKTASITEILRALREVRTGGAPMSPAIARKVLEMFGRFGGGGTSRGRATLTTREQDVLKALAHGSSMNEISAQLDISYHTVDTHLRHIYAKLHVRSATAAVARAVRDGLV